MANHLHTKSVNADKIETLIHTIAKAKERASFAGTKMLVHEIDNIAALAVDAEFALKELKEQTGII